VLTWVYDKMQFFITSSFGIPCAWRLARHSILFLSPQRSITITYYFNEALFLTYFLTITSPPPGTHRVTRSRPGDGRRRFGRCPPKGPFQVTFGVPGTYN
jgi:hypothetical protein